MPASNYRGRFAPSPTGPLHAGSLLAALASYLDARSQSGRWLLRIEDVDQLRVVPESENQIKRALEAHGLLWDEETDHQSMRTERYRDVLERLIERDKLFTCSCTRKQVIAQGGVYAGTCRSRRAKPEHASAEEPDFSLRFNTDGLGTISIIDRVQGAVSFDFARLGDFVVRRRDGLVAYQLAVVVDDYDQGITDVVRGYDIIDSTPWQRALQQACGFDSPSYLHTPILTQRGHKLSKQTGASNLLDDPTPGREVRNLLAALEQLGQPIPEHGEEMDCEQLLQHAVQDWDVNLIPKSTEIALDTVT